MSRQATRRRQGWCFAGRSGYDTPVNLTAWRSWLKRQICRRIVFRFLMAGGVLLSALLPVYLFHSLNVQHLALLQAAFDEREICLEPQRAELARQRALQRQAETENLRQQQTARENRRYRICWFFCRLSCRKMPGWRVIRQSSKSMIQKAVYVMPCR